MEQFILTVFDHFNLVPDEENVFKLGEETFIFLADEGDSLSLFCPCLAIPANQEELVSLLSLNYRSDTVFGAIDNVIMARLAISEHESAAGMAVKFQSFVSAISAARQIAGLDL